MSKLKENKQFNLIGHLTNILVKYDNICPKDCTYCEYKELMILLPGEEKYWNYSNERLKKFHFFKGYYYLESKNEPCPFFTNKYCNVYEKRSIDCRIFPFFLVFNIEEKSFIIEKAGKYCPIVNQLPTGFEEDVIKACEVINKEVPDDWKLLYNKTNLTPSLSNLV